MLDGKPRSAFGTAVVVSVAMRLVYKSQNP
jgi:hypothetical protein